MCIAMRNSNEKVGGDGNDVLLGNEGDDKLYGDNSNYFFRGPTPDLSIKFITFFAKCCAIRL